MSQLFIAIFFLVVPTTVIQTHSLVFLLDLDNLDILTAPEKRQRHVSHDQTQKSRMKHKTYRTCPHSTSGCSVHEGVRGSVGLGGSPLKDQWPGSSSRTGLDGIKY